MKKPYIKKISNVSNFIVWIVDGKHIRDKTDDQFTNFGQHYQFNFIPEDELWIDKASKASERKLYIQIMLMMNKLMKEGLEHKEAVEKVGEFEQAERDKSKLMQEKEKLKGEPKRLIESLHKKFLKEFSNDRIKTWVVDSEAVRGLFFLDFTHGGHHYVYNFIPKDEIWIDDDIGKDEVKLVLIHELHERRLMAKGGKYIHGDLRANDAHARASKVESYCRKHPDKLDKKLKKELERNK